MGLGEGWGDGAIFGERYALAPSSLSSRVVRRAPDDDAAAADDDDDLYGVFFVLFFFLGALEANFEGVATTGSFDTSTTTLSSSGATRVHPSVDATIPSSSAADDATSSFTKRSETSPALILLVVAIDRPSEAPNGSCRPFSFSLSLSLSLSR